MKLIRTIVNKTMMLLRENVAVGNQTGLRIWKGLVCDKKSKIQVGNISVRDNCHIESKNGGTIKMGNGVNFNYNCTVVCHDIIQMGDYISIGPNVMIYDHDHDYKDENWRKKFTTEKVSIGNNVWIGGNVIILKGTTIGNNCVIAAGTILANRTIPDNSIVYNKTNLVIKEIQKN